MAEPYTSGHQSVNHRSTSPSDDDMPSTTVREGDSSYETLLDDGSPASSTRPDRTLRSWCYTLHAFLVAIHAALVAMLFTHPEHRFSVSIDNTTATIVLKVFLQAFYTIYTAVLVFIVQRLAIYAAMAKQQKLTTVHDVHGAWNSIGAAIHTLWQQTKVMSSPSTILLVLAYLSCITGLHIISSSVIQFEAFNNTIVNVVPSTLAWPYSSVNLTSIDWANVSPLTALWPLLSSAKGLNGSVLYDVPISNDPYIEAAVNTTSINADCGLLSNSLVGNWDSTQGIYSVNVTGLGEVPLNVPGPNMVIFFDSELVENESTCSLCNNYIFSQISTNVDLGNLTGQVVQLDVDGPIRISASPAPSNITVPTTSFFVACTLNTINAIQNLSMQNGQIILNKESTPEPWKIWSPGSTTELTQMLNTAHQGLLSLPLACLKTQLSPSGQQCNYMSVVDLYLNKLLGIPWMLGSAATAEMLPSIALGSKKFEDSIAQIAAELIWLASTFATGEGIQQIEGKSEITNLVLELRLNVNITPAILGLFTSIILFVIMAWMLHGPYPKVSKRGITSPSILELMWISAHSTTFQGFMTRINNSIPDQLRIEGTKTEVCLLNLDVGTTKLYRDEDNSFKSDSTIYNWNQLYKKEHHVIMPVYNTQAFYVLYTAALVFIVQQLAISKLLAQRQHLTTVHDIANAWTGIGAAFSTLLQQNHLPSSIWAIIGVALYLGCVSVMHIASTTIMEFTAYNSTSITSIPTLVTWPNSSVIANGSWTYAIQTVPPISLVNDLQTNGLLNNTIYDILTTTQSNFANATVNATSLQATCGLLSNLSWHNSTSTSGPMATLNFSTDGFGHGAFSLIANVEIDKSVTTSQTDLSCYIPQDNGPPIKTYVAACSLIPQTANVTLDLQTNSLISSLLQASSQPWKLWTPEAGGSLNFTSDVYDLVGNTPFVTCPINGEICSLSINPPPALQVQNTSLYTLPPNQLEQSLEQLVAAMIWIAGELGPSQGGFMQTQGQSPVTQVITEWRLNINTTPVVFASGASLVLLVLAFLLAGIPAKYAHPHSSINGVSMLETLWIAAHSRTIREHMADIEEPSLDNLRKAGMFTIRLGDVHASRSLVSESEAFLE
ncbi:hypothetical protein L210DRAFT_3633500 [Boletus edulis BED1]|uniref:Transmembrane protein n=1 Tax=Boletus edulis BED1 TaxID=1328754 RepID=A0AAD4BJ20_BOLED|nr:hypothetical protein L210DRAFT_3633500 [Boletus edulis BED1]